jgi:hypothetical protein
MRSNFLGGLGLNKTELEPDPVIEAYKKHVDRTVIRENLRRSVEERFLALMELQRFAEGLRAAWPTVHLGCRHGTAGSQLHADD